MPKNVGVKSDYFTFKILSLLENLRTVHFQVYEKKIYEDGNF